jgi:Ca-activated chloride channel homolog
MRRRHSLFEHAASLLLFASLFSLGCGGVQEKPQETANGIDDWAFSPTSSADSTAMAGGGYNAPAPVASAAGPTVTTSGGGTVGMATGGAKDINNFRENIANNYLPLATDITYEGVFYDYYFDTGATSKCNALFCPSYVPMLSTDPLSKVQEPYLSVGLNSGIKESDFARKRLNLVVVLDVSGSMGSPFDAYYYDQSGNQIRNTMDADKSKLAIATESIVAMLGHLKAGDRVGVVLFTDAAYQAKPLSSVEETDMDALAGHILALSPLDSTNMEAGYQMGADMLAKLGQVDPATYESRIILLTDAMPNTGDTSAGSLSAMVATSAAARIFTTFIGIGVDFNSSLIELLTKTRGANYYSVHGSKEFKLRLDEEFDFMVTPLVFDLKLALQSDSFQVKDVYGSPEADQATGTLIFVNTLFPSRSENGQTKGGVMLALLEQTGLGKQISLAASYQDRSGIAAGNQVDFAYAATLDRAPNLGVRKAVLLARYVRLVKAWITSERQSAAAQAGATAGTDWERTSLPLTVSDACRTQFQAFAAYFKGEMAAIGDGSLAQEVTVLAKLAQ